MYHFRLDWHDQFGSIKMGASRHSVVSRSDGALALYSMLAMKGL